MKKLLLLYLSVLVLSGCSTHTYMCASNNDLRIYKSTKAALSGNYLSTYTVKSKKYFKAKHTQRSDVWKIRYNKTVGYVKSPKFDTQIRTYGYFAFTYDEAIGFYVKDFIPFYDSHYKAYDSGSSRKSSLGSYKSSSSKSSSGGTVNVKGYYRKNGTYVKPHTRSAPKRR